MAAILFGICVVDELDHSIDLKWSVIMTLEWVIVVFWLLDIIIRNVVMGKEAYNSWYLILDIVMFAAIVACGITYFFFIEYVVTGEIADLVVMIIRFC